MSCEKRLNKMSATAGLRAGISRLQSKAGSVTGSLLTTVTRGVGRSATAALAVTENFTGPSLDTLGTAALVAAALRSETSRRRTLALVGVSKMARGVSFAVGTGLARFSRLQADGVSGGITEQFFFKSNTPVRMWPSRLTPLLNSRDVSGLGQIKASQGAMLETEGQTWHLGQTQVETIQGKRTLTHLQRMSLPPKHYYFDRPLSDSEAVGIIAGQKGFDPRQMPGYAGAISEGESLAPAWAEAKKSLIKVHILWGRKP